MGLKRKRVAGKAAKDPAASKSATRRAADAAAAEAAGDVDSGDEESDDDLAEAVGEDEDSDFFETPDEKRVRLAKEYLRTLESGGAGDGSKAEVQEQLAKDVDEKERRTRSQVQNLKLGEPRFLKGHKESVTCVALSSDDSTMFTGGKDCAILRWDVETGKKDVFPGGRNLFDCGGHFGEVLGLCLLEQRKLVASVGVDRVVRFWDWQCPPRTACVKKLFGHTDTASAIAAEPDGTQVYTGSYDKSVKVWDLAAMRCTDTLFGHVAGVTSMDIYHKGRPATGGCDKTVRLWKIDKETHLMFSKHTYAVDAVSILDHDRLVSSSQDGKIHLWTHASKKPLATASLKSGVWVTALGTIRACDVVFSGSTSGELRSWQTTMHKTVEADGKKGGVVTFHEAAPAVSAPGVINAVAVGQRFVACAVGKDHRLGGWYFDKKHRNGVLLVPLSYSKT